jgi:hypothetical protein
MGMDKLREIEEKLHGKKLFTLRIKLPIEWIKKLFKRRKK